MELIRNRVKAHYKKYFILLVIIPLILAGIGWILPVGKENSLYTAVATISLGNYGNADLNSSKQVNTLLTNIPFYQNYVTELWNEKQNQIVGNLQVLDVAEDRIKLSYTEKSKEKAVQILSEITDSFLTYDHERFTEKKNIIQKTIQTVKNAEVSKDTIVDQQRFLYELQNDLQDIKPASLLKSADLENVELENRAISSKERAVLGGLLGITFALFFILIPEFIRDQSN